MAAAAKAREGAAKSDAEKQERWGDEKEKVMPSSFDPARPPEREREKNLFVSLPLSLDSVPLLFLYFKIR